MSNFLILLIIIAYIVTIISLIVVVVSDNKNPIKAISWALVLVFLPIIGLLIYIIFGQRFTKERIISNRSYSKLKKEPINKVLEFGEYNVDNYPNNHQHLVKLLKNYDDTPIFGGNDITIFTDGKTKLESLLNDIEKAKHHIHLEYYIIEDDEIGKKIKNALIKKSLQGVEVRFIYDSFGSRKIKKKFFEDMRKSGIEIEPFLKLVIPVITSRINYRNHRKIVVIDGEIGYIGGMNIADRYINGVTWGEWRDTHIKVKGRAVHALQSIFFIDWYFVSKTLITSKTYFPNIDYFGNSIIQMVNSGPIGENREILSGIIQSIYDAEKLIFIQTPYFIPPDNLILALKIAAKRGVDVRIILNKKSDIKLVQYASDSFIKEMLLSGIKIYAYNKGFIHSKMIIFDHELTLIGSANFDTRSFEQNFEVESFIYDENVSKQSRAIFLEDQKQSDQIILREWLKRPRTRRIAESIMHLFAPLL